MRKESSSGLPDGVISFIIFSNVAVNFFLCQVALWTLPSKVSHALPETRAHPGHRVMREDLQMFTARHKLLLENCLLNQQDIMFSEK